MRLEREASAAGGRAQLVLGNHEIMNLTGELDYVASEDYAAYAAEESTDRARGGARSVSARRTRARPATTTRSRPISRAAIRRASSHSARRLRAAGASARGFAPTRSARARRHRLRARRPARGDRRQVGRRCERRIFRGAARLSRGLRRARRGRRAARGGRVRGAARDCRSLPRRPAARGYARGGVRSGRRRSASRAHGVGRVRCLGGVLVSRHRELQRADRARPALRVSSPRSMRSASSWATRRPRLRAC